VYCAAVLDAYSRRIVGWSLDDNMRTNLVIDARYGHDRRRPQRNSAILHSDHGAQYTPGRSGSGSGSRTGSGNPPKP
jgi:putative transposase